MTTEWITVNASPPDTVFVGENGTSYLANWLSTEKNPSIDFTVIRTEELNTYWSRNHAFGHRAIVITKQIYDEREHYDFAFANELKTAARYRVRENQNEHIRRELRKTEFGAFRVVKDIIIPHIQISIPDASARQPEHKLNALHKSVCLRATDLLHHEDRLLPLDSRRAFKSITTTLANSMKLATRIADLAYDPANDYAPFGGIIASAEAKADVYFKRIEKTIFKTYNNREIEAIINPPLPSAEVVINSINGRTGSPANVRVDYSNGAAAGVIEWQYFFNNRFWTPIPGASGNSFTPDVALLGSNRSVKIRAVLKGATGLTMDVVSNEITLTEQ